MSAMTALKLLFPLDVEKLSEKELKNTLGIHIPLHWRHQKRFLRILIFAVVLLGRVDNS